MDPSELSATLERDGYAVVNGVLPPDAVAALAAELLPLCEATPVGRNPFEGFHTRRIYNLIAKSRGVHSLVTHPLVMAAVEAFLGKDSTLLSCQGMYLSPGAPAQRLHHDDALYPVPRPRPPLGLSAMWAIDDFRDDNGATRIVPGSHRWGAEPVDPDMPSIAVEMPAGSVLFYLGTTYHCGGGNRSSAPRFGVNVLYAQGWLRQYENQYLGVPREMAATLDPALQRLLGYGVYGEYLGYVDGRHPSRVLKG